jgi:cell division protein FtsQ
MSVESPPEEQIEPVAAPIDPRFRARRVMVVRQQGRRRLRALVAALATLVALAAVWMILESPLLDIDHVDVVGAQHVSADTVRAAAKVRVGAPLAFVNLGAIEHRVEALPWVEHAAATRDWLDRIRISVSERVPVLWVRRAKDGVVLIDRTGRVLGDEAAHPDGVPELRGTPVNVAPGRRLPARDGVELLDQLPASLRGRLVAIVMDGGEATMQLAFAPDIRLGQVEDVSAKLAAAQAVLEHIGTQRVKYIDVRVPDAPTTG